MCGQNAEYFMSFELMTYWLLVTSVLKTNQVLFAKSNKGSDKQLREI